MRTFPVCLTSLALLFVGILVECSQTPAQSPGVSDAIRKSLDQAGLKHVSAAQDHEKGVVTLAGHVATGCCTIQNKLHKDVTYTAKHAVVTLTGEVNTQAQRAMAENVYTCST
jgi:hypothetical protein